MKRIEARGHRVSVEIATRAGERTVNAGANGGDARGASFLLMLPCAHGFANDFACRSAGADAGFDRLHHLFRKSDAQLFRCGHGMAPSSVIELAG